MTVLTRSCVGNTVSAAMAELLLKAGANPNLPAEDGQGETALMDAVVCPDVLEVMLSVKPDLNVVDKSGWTVMHHAIKNPDTREPSSALLLQAGFDMARWTAKS